MKKKKYSYKHFQSGHTLKVEIRDETRRLEYRNKINLNDSKAKEEFLIVLQKYGFSIYDIIKDQHI